MKRRPVKESVEMKRLLNHTYLNYARKRRDNFSEVDIPAQEEAQILGFIKGLEFALSEGDVPDYIKKFVIDFA
jgi:hypothetical protein